MVKWEEQLFGCCQGSGYCFLVLICPIFYPIFQGCTVHKATGDPWAKACCLPLFFCCIGGACNRGKIRDRYLIEGSFCEDCLTHCFCCFCAVCQEHVEVRNKERM